MKYSSKGKNYETGPRPSKAQRTYNWRKRKTWTRIRTPIWKAWNKICSGSPWQSRDQDTVLSLPWPQVQSPHRERSYKLQHNPPKKQKKKEKEKEKDLLCKMTSSISKLANFKNYTYLFNSFKLATALLTFHFHKSLHVIMLSNFSCSWWVADLGLENESPHPQPFAFSISFLLVPKLEHNQGATQTRFSV